MDSTRATAERKTPRELSVKRNVRGDGQAAQTKLENSGQAIFSAIWSSSQETSFSTLIERVNALQATHDANPGAKAGPVRTAQIDSLTVRIETQFFERFEASVRGTPGLLLGTIPGDLTDGQRARIAQHDANLVLFLTLMNLSSSTHELRLAMQLTMDQARLASLSAAE